jgi:hypothetical protein
MAGCDWVGSGSETVGDGGHLQPPSCHCGPLERAPEGGQALFGVPIFLCRLFSGKLSLLFIEIHCVKILRFVSRWTEKRVFCGKTFDYGVPIPSGAAGKAGLSGRLCGIIWDPKRPLERPNSCTRGVDLDPRVLIVFQRNRAPPRGVRMRKMERGRGITEPPQHAGGNRRHECTSYALYIYILTTAKRVRQQTIPGNTTTVRPCNQSCPAASLGLAPYPLISQVFRFQNLSTFRA